MSDVEARILAASDEVTVRGEDYKLAPLSLLQLAEIQRKALRFYKNNYITTFKDNVDIFPEDQRLDILAKKLDEVGRWDINDLPPKPTYDVRNVTITPALKEKILSFFEPEQAEGWETWKDPKWTAVLGAVMDAGQITSEAIQKLTNTKPTTVKIPYDMWWVTAAYEGMLTLVYESVKINQPHIKHNDVAKWPMPDIMDAARIVEQITSPAWGNT